MNLTEIVKEELSLYNVESGMPGYERLRDVVAYCIMHPAITASAAAEEVGNEVGLSRGAIIAMASNAIMESTYEGKMSIFVQEVSEHIMERVWGEYDV